MVSLDAAPAPPALPHQREPVGPGYAGTVVTSAKPANTCGCGKLAARAVHGPYLRLAGYDPETEAWTGSCLVVAKGAALPGRPQLRWSDDAGRGGACDGFCLDSYCDWNFWRFSLEIPMTDAQVLVSYQVEVAAAAPLEGSFHVAARHQPWHWGYYSCNGFTADVPPEDVDRKWRGIDPLWNDVLARHKEAPLHAMVGGGDQLYCDDVLQCPALGAFFKAEEGARPGMAFGEDMQDEVEAYYFHHYAVHFSFGAFGRTLASIPHVMSWDDHDTFDGWGSYPELLQQCPVFTGIFQASLRFYLLFQLHTTKALAASHGVFGRSSFNQLVLLGPRVAVALPDCRAERTETQVLPLDTHMNLVVKANALPDSVTHLVVGTTVPVVYPHLKGGESILTCLGSLNKNAVMHSCFNATGVGKAVFNDVDEPELLDDLRDHWSAPTHQEERRFLIEHLQMLSKARNMRISLVSGDVHLGATGRMYSFPKVDRHRDFRYMPQIVSSAIANPPPPDGLVTVLHVMGRSGFFNRKTKYKMCKLLGPKRSARLLNRRNWCEVWELADAPAGASPASTPRLPPLSPGVAHDRGALVFALRMEEWPEGVAPGSEALPSMVEYQTLVEPLHRPPPPPGWRADKHQSTDIGVKALNRRYAKELAASNGSHTSFKQVT